MGELWTLNKFPSQIWVLDYIYIYALKHGYLSNLHPVLDFT